MFFDNDFEFFECPNCHYEMTIFESKKGRCVNCSTVLNNQNVELSSKKKKDKRERKTSQSETVVWNNALLNITHSFQNFFQLPKQFHHAVGGLWMRYLHLCYEVPSEVPRSFQKPNGALCLSLNFLAALWLRAPIMAVDIINAINEGNILYTQSLCLKNQEFAVPYVPSATKIRKSCQKLANFLGMEIPPPNVLMHAKKIVKQFGLNDQVAGVLLHHAQCVTVKLSQEPFKIALYPYNEGAMGHEEYIMAILIISVKMTFGTSTLEDFVSMVSQTSKSAAFYSLSSKNIQELASNPQQLNKYITFYEKMYPNVHPKLEDLYTAVKAMMPDFIPTIPEEDPHDDQNVSSVTPDPLGVSQYPLFQNIKTQAPYFEKFLNICSEYAMIEPIPLLAFVRKIECYLQGD